MVGRFLPLALALQNVTKIAVGYAERRTELQGPAIPEPRFLQVSPAKNNVAEIVMRVWEIGLNFDDLPIKTLSLGQVSSLLMSQGQGKHVQNGSHCG